MSATTLSSASAVSLVARREISAKLRDKGFLLSTVFIAVAILASVLLPVAFGGDDVYHVGIVDADEPLAQAIPARAEASGQDVELTTYSDAQAARTALADGAEDAVVEMTVEGPVIVVEDTLDDPLRQVLDAAYADVVAVARLQAAGIDAAEVAQALDVEPLAVEMTDPDADRNAQRQLVAFLGVVVLYGLLILIGQYVAMGVVEEKSSRVVELLLSTIRPWQLLAGKVIGLGLLGLAQLVVIAVVGLGASLQFDVLTVPSEAIGTMVQVIGWFVLGYGFYAAVFAAGAALVSRQEDLQTVLMPTIVVLVAAFLIAIQALQDPDSILAVVCSLVPGLSPLVMPVRIAAGDVPWWEVGLAVLLMLVSIVGLVRLGGRIYAGALLRTGGRVKIKDALASSR